MTRRHRQSQRTQGFTLVEVILAITIASFILGAVWASVGQMARARSTSRDRLAAFVRADAALNAIRRDVASVLRSDDLFWTKLRIVDGLGSGPFGTVDRDDLLLFSTRMRLSRAPSTFDDGEGIEYETQYRVMDDSNGSVLWQRRDSVPDEWYDGGGVVTPIAEGVVGLNARAFDGEGWWDTWESDEQGLPHAIEVSILVAITGAEFERPILLRTVIAIDRVLPPFDAGAEEEEEAGPTEEDEGTGEAGSGSTGGGGGGGFGGGGGGTDVPPRGGGNRGRDGGRGGGRGGDRDFGGPGGGRGGGGQRGDLP